MKLPEAKPMLTTWALPTVNAWAELQTKASKMEGDAGHNDAFTQMLTYFPPLYPTTLTLPS